MRADLIERLRHRADYEDEPDFTIFDAEIMREAADALASQEPAASAISVQDPMMILAGIKQFGLAADGADLRDLAAAIERIASQETVAWRVKITDASGMTKFVYTECLPFEPFMDSGVTVRAPPEPLVVASPVVPVAAKAEAEGWRLIETAPKDGTEILLYGPGVLIRKGTSSMYARARHIGWWDGHEFWLTRDPEVTCRAEAWRPLPAAPPGKGDGQP